MTKAVLLILCASFPLVALADYSHTGIEIKCLRSQDQLQFNAVTLVNEPALWAAAAANERSEFISAARARNLYLEGAFEHRCKLGRSEVRVWGEILKPAERGECGAARGGKVYLSIDEIRVLHFLTFGNGCFPSVVRASVNVRDGGANRSFVLCAHARPGKEVKCVTRTIPVSDPMDKSRPLVHQGDLERLAQ